MSELKTGDRVQYTNNPDTEKEKAREYTVVATYHVQDNSSWAWIIPDNPGPPITVQTKFLKKVPPKWEVGQWYQWINPELHNEIFKCLYVSPTDGRAVVAYRDDQGHFVSWSPVASAAQRSRKSETAGRAL